MFSILEKHQDHIMAQIIQIFRQWLSEFDSYSRETTWEPFTHIGSIQFKFTQKILKQILDSNTRESNFECAPFILLVVSISRLLGPMINKVKPESFDKAVSFWRRFFFSNKTYVANFDPIMKALVLYQKFCHAELCIYPI